MVGKLRVVLLSAFVLLPLIVSATSSSSASSSSSSSSSSSGGHGSGGHAVWYSVPQQQTLLECIVYACVACLALIFEYAHHKDSHMLEKEMANSTLINVYGQAEEEGSSVYRKGKVMGVATHMFRIWQRFSSELMVLGFISFLSWCLEQAEVFKEISSDLSDDYSQFPDALSLVHTIHAVHQWIFIAFMIHFMTSTFVVYYIVTTVQRKIAKYERWVHTVHRHDKHPDAECEELKDIDVIYGNKYANIRQRFVDYCKVNGKQYLVGKTLDDEAVQQMDKEDYNEEHHKQYHVTDDYVFSLYTTLNQDRVLTDFYHFHPASWGFLLILKVIESLILYGTLDTHNYQWGYEFGCDLFLATVGIIVGLIMIVLFWKLSERNMEGGKFSKDRMCLCLFQSCCKFENDQSTELWLGRMFQAFSFTLAYELASSVGDKNFWDAVDIAQYPMSASEYHALYMCILLVCWPVFGFILTKVLITICLDFSMPPYMDKDHWHLVKTSIKAGALVHKHWKTEFDVFRASLNSEQLQQIQVAVTENKTDHDEL